MLPLDLELIIVNGVLISRISPEIALYFQDIIIGLLLWSCNIYRDIFSRLTWDSITQPVEGLNTSKPMPISAMSDMLIYLHGESVRRKPQTILPSSTIDVYNR